MGEFTNRPVNSLTDVHFEVHDRGIHAVLDRLERRLATHESALRLLALEDGRFGRLRREADALLATFPQPRLRPYLFGVPIVVEEGLQLGLADLVTRGQEVSARQLREDRSGRTRLRAQLTALMDRHRIDLWLSPASAGVTLRTFSPTDRQVMGIPWTYAGLPTLSVLAGRDAAGVPVGLQIAGRWGGDAELLAWAREIGRVAAL